MSQDRLSCAVVVSTMNRPDTLRALLASLQRQTRRPDELVVVDAGAPEPTAKLLAELWPDALHRPLPSSLTQARAAGVRASKADTVAFVDDDMVLEPDALAAVLAVLERDRRWAGGTGRMTPVPWSADKPARRAYRWAFGLSLAADGRLRRSGLPTSVRAGSGFRAVQFISGGFGVYRREVFAFAGHDQRLPGYGFLEDVDFSHQLRGVNLFFEPAAVVIHTAPDAGLTRAGERRQGYAFTRNHFYLVAKHHRDPLAWGWSVAGNLLLHLRWRQLHWCGASVRALWDIARGARGPV